jgi:hypothetical protein
MSSSRRASDPPVGIRTRRRTVPPLALLTMVVVALSTGCKQRGDSRFRHETAADTSQLENMCARVRERAIALGTGNPRTAIGRTRIRRGIRVLASAVDQIARFRPTRRKLRYREWTASMRRTLVDFQQEVELSLDLELRPSQFRHRPLRLGSRERVRPTRPYQRLDRAEARLRRDVFGARRRGRDLGFRKCAALFG